MLKNSAACRNACPIRAAVAVAAGFDSVFAGEPTPWMEAWMDQRFAVPGVDATTPLGEAAPALLLAKAEPLFALEAAASSGADMDAVHDMRVASRRLRETMRLLEPLYPRREFRAWYARVRRITSALGPVRDADVFIDEFGCLGKDLGDGGRRAIAFLVGQRMGTRERELVVLNRELARLDLAQNRRTLRKLARSIAVSADTKRPVAAFAHAAIAQRAGVVFGAMPAALPPDNVAEQHALRIDFKRLRYAVEVFAPVYGEDFDELHETLTAFQDTLGDLHDLHLFLDQLRDSALLQAARRAGVSAKDIGQVTAVLEDGARQVFAAFVALADRHPAEELLPQLLLPLSRPPQPQTPDAEEPPPTQETPTVIARTPSPAVVLEPPAPVGPGSMPPIDPAAQPWRSDTAGLAINPPVVVGAEPWARPTVSPAGTQSDESDSPVPVLEERT
jgi:CHAD domain-containing protein